MFKQRSENLRSGRWSTNVKRGGDGRPLHVERLEDRRMLSATFQSAPSPAAPSAPLTELVASLTIDLNIRPRQLAKTEGGFIVTGTSLLQTYDADLRVPSADLRNFSVNDLLNNQQTSLRGSVGGLISDRATFNYGGLTPVTVFVSGDSDVTQMATQENWQGPATTSTFSEGGAIEIPKLVAGLLQERELSLQTSQHAARPNVRVSNPAASLAAVPVSGELARGIVFEMIGRGAIPDASESSKGTLELNPSTDLPSDKAAAPSVQTFDGEGRALQSRHDRANEPVTHIEGNLTAPHRFQPKPTTRVSTPNDTAVSGSDNSLFAAIASLPGEHEHDVESSVESVGAAFEQSILLPVTERISDSPAIENETAVLHRLRVGANLVIPALVALSMVKISKVRLKHAEEPGRREATIPS